LLCRTYSLAQAACEPVKKGSTRVMRIQYLPEQIGHFGFDNRFYEESSPFKLLFLPY
jgi:hypothetical protein